MPNKAYSLEWLRFARRDLETAILLFDANHYEDTIGVQLQQAIEKSLKALFAYKNKKIPREHDLIKIFFLLDDDTLIDDDEVMLLKIATNYYKDERYPNPYYTLPPREEIRTVLSFSKKLLESICLRLDIDKTELAFTPEEM